MNTVYPSRPAFHGLNCSIREQVSVDHVLRGVVSYSPFLCRNIP